MVEIVVWILKQIEIDGHEPLLSVSVAVLINASFVYFQLQYCTRHCVPRPSATDD